MSKTQNPNEQTDLSTPNAQEFLTSATSKSGKPTILVDYPALLKASGDDKALAYSRLKNTESVNFDFGILDHELGNDSAAAFDALASQNAILAGYKSEDEKKQKAAARAKFAENLAKSTDSNADYLTQKKAQAAVYDYIGTQGFNEDESEAQSAYKKEVLNPFKQEINQLEIQTRLDDYNAQGFDKFQSYIKTAENLEQESGILGSSGKKSEIINNAFKSVTNDEFRNFWENYEPNTENSTIKQRYGKNTLTPAERDKKQALRLINQQNFDISNLSEADKAAFLQRRGEFAKDKMDKHGADYYALQKKKNSPYIRPYNDVVLKDSFGNPYTYEQQQKALGLKNLTLNEQVGNALTNAPLLYDTIKFVDDIQSVITRKELLPKGEFMGNFAFNANKDENIAKNEENIRAMSLQARERGTNLNLKDLTYDELMTAAYKGFQWGYKHNKNADALGLGAAWAKMTRDNDAILKAAQDGLDIIGEEAVIASTPFKELNKKQKKFLNQSAGIWVRGKNRIFDGDDSETLEQEYNTLKGGTMMPIAAAFTEKLRNFKKAYNLVNIGGQLAWQTAGGTTARKEELDEFIAAANSTAKFLGFDGAQLNKKGDIVTYKMLDNGEMVAATLNDDFIEQLPETIKNNIGSVLGAIGGEILFGNKFKSAQKAATRMGRIKQGLKRLTPAAIGGAAGSSIDYVNFCLENGQEIDFSEMLLHGVQDAAFSYAGDAIIHLGGKAIKALDAKTADLSLRQMVTKGAAKTAEFADKAIEKFPVLGAVTSPVRNFFKGNNISAAEDLMLKNYTKEQRAEIETLLKEQGGGINLGTTERLQFAADKLTQKYGADSQIAQTAQNFVDAFNLKGFKERQSRLLQLIISDESGKNLGYLIEVAKNNPEVERQIENMVRYSTSHLKAALSKLDLPENQLKDIFNDFEKGTKESFGDAMRIIGDEFYPADIYKTKIDKTPFENLIKNANEQAVFTGEAEKRFLNEVITPLFDEKGVSFTQLANIRRNLNQYYKKIDSPTLKDFISGQVGAELRTAIDNGINDIFKQNPAAYSKIKALDETALRDYSAMKDIRGVLKKLNFYNEQTSFADDLDKLINFVLTGKGNEAVPNLERLLSKLTPENRAAAEINILNQILENAKVIYKRQYGGDSIETFHTFQFLDTLEALARRGNVFKSAPAQDFIKIVKDWHTLNKNHAVILSDLRPANVKEIRGSIATSIEGRLAQMRTNIIMSNMFRLLDKIPFISNIGWNGSSIWDRTQAGALRWHIKNALSRSVTMDDFKLKVLERVDKGGFNNATKQILREIAQTAEQTEQNLAKMQDFEDAVLQKASEDATQPAQNLGENLAQNSQGGSLLERARAANAEKRAAQQAEQKKWDDFDDEVNNAWKGYFDSTKANRTASETAQNAAENASETATARSADDLAENSQKFTQNEPQNTAQDDILRELDEPDKNNPFERAMREKRAEQNSQVTPPNVKVMSETTAQSAPSTPAATQNVPTSTANATNKAIYDNNMRILKENLQTADEGIKTAETTAEKNEWKRYKATQEQAIKDLQAANPEHAAAEQKIADDIARERESSTPLTRDESIAENRLMNGKQRLLNEINPAELTDEQRGVFEVFTGQRDKITLQGKDANDLYTLEKGSRTKGAKKILIKHGGEEKTGGLTNAELLDMMKVVRNGEIADDSFTMHDDFIRYAYDLNENGENLRLVVEEYNDGRKVFDYYSDRNFTDYPENPQRYQKNSQEKSQANELAPQDEPKSETETYEQLYKEGLFRILGAFGSVDGVLKTIQKAKEYKEFLETHADNFFSGYLWGWDGRLDESFAARRAREMSMIDNFINNKSKEIIERLKSEKEFKASLKDKPELNELQKVFYDAIRMNDGYSFHLMNVKEPSLKTIAEWMQLDLPKEKRLSVEDYFKTNIEGENYKYFAQDFVGGRTGICLFPNRDLSHNFYSAINSYFTIKHFEGKDLSKLSERDLMDYGWGVYNFKIFDKQRQGLSKEAAEKAARAELYEEFSKLPNGRELIPPEYRKSANFNENSQAQPATSRTASETAENAQDLGENSAKNGEDLSDLSENSAAQGQKAPHRADGVDTSRTPEQQETERTFLNKLFKIANTCREIDAIKKEYDGLEYKNGSVGENLTKEFNKLQRLRYRNFNEIENFMTENRLWNDKYYLQKYGVDEIDSFETYAVDLRKEFDTKREQELSARNLQAQKAEPASEPKADETPTQNTAQTQQNAEMPKAETASEPKKPKMTFKEFQAKTHELGEQEKKLIKQAKDEAAEREKNAPKAKSTLQNIKDLRQEVEEYYYEANKKLRPGFIEQIEDRKAKIADLENRIKEKNRMGDYNTDSLYESIDEYKNEIKHNKKGLIDYKGEMTSEYEYWNKRGKLVKGETPTIRLNNIQSAAESAQAIRNALATQDDIEKETFERLSGLADIIEKHTNTAINNTNTKAQNEALLEQKIREIQNAKSAERADLKEQFYSQYDPVGVDLGEAKSYIRRWKLQNEELDFSDAKIRAEGGENYYKRMVQERQGITEYLKIKPLAEFGQNFVEFYRDGTGAVKKLLAEADEAAKNGAEFNGQVAGAFYRDELGDIDLVWGSDSKGLKRILATKDGEQIADIIERGNLQINGTRGTITSERGSLAVEKQGDRWILDSADGTNGGGTAQPTTLRETPTQTPATSRPASETAQNSQNLGENSAAQTAKSETKAPASKEAKAELMAKKAQKVQEKAYETQYFAAEKNLQNSQKELDNKQQALREIDGTLAHRKEQISRIEQRIQAFEQEVKRYSQFSSRTAAKRAHGVSGERGYNRYVERYQSNRGELDLELSIAKQALKGYEAQYPAQKAKAQDELDKAQRAFDSAKAEFEALEYPQSMFEFGGVHYHKDPSEKELKDFWSNASGNLKNQAGREMLIERIDTAKSKNAAQNIEIFRKALKENNIPQPYVDFFERLVADENARREFLGLRDTSKRLLESENIEAYVRKVNRPPVEARDPRNTYQVEREKRAVKKDLELINSPRYQENLKKWADGSSKYFLNDDGTPIMIDGFYWSDKRAARGTDFEYQVTNAWGTKETKRVSAEDAADRHKAMIEELKNAKTRKEILTIFNLYGDILERKSVLNDGTFSPTSANILAMNGGEVLGSGFTFGTINGIEQDENGNITFNPQKFLNGFIMGAGGAKAVKLAIQKSPAIRAKAEKFAAKSAEFLNEALQNPLILPQERTRFAVVANKALNSALDNRKFIIGGEGAIGANREKLARARVMQKQGKDEGEIWDKTGWYLDKDGKWKFEINAAGASAFDTDKIQEVIRGADEGGRSVNLNEIIEDKPLFKAYPQLVKLKVVASHLGDYGKPQAKLAKLTNGELVMVLNADKSYDLRGLKSINTIYHELQHAVQEIENFARGGSAKEVGGFENYKKLHGEVEARNIVQRRENATELKAADFLDLTKREISDLKKAIKSHPYKTQDVDIKDTIIHGQGGKAAAQSIVERE